MTIDVEVTFTRDRGPAPAIAAAAEWAHELKVPLRLVHVLEPGAGYAPSSGQPDLLDGGYLANLAQRVAGDTPEFEVLHGDAAEAVAAYADAHAELAVVTTHGRGGIARTVLGSVAMKIVHRTTCPVLAGRVRSDH